MARFGITGNPWDCKGSINVSDCKTSEEVLVKAGLNFNVSKCSLVAKMPLDTNGMSDDELDRINSEINKGEIFLKNTDSYRECPNAFATYRTDYNIPLGIVKNKYTIVQNTDAFNFFDDAIGPNKAIWQTAGAWGNGERIFVSAKLPNNILVHGDPVDTYLVFTNSHDGSSGVKILFTPIRIICKNTLTAAIRSTQNYVTFRHTNQVHNKIALAQEILGISKIYAEETQEKYNHLYTIKMTDEQVMKYLCEQFMSEDEMLKLEQAKYNPKHIVNRYWTAIEASEISMRKANQIADTWEYYNVGAGQKEIAGTAWGAVNAVTGYLSNVDSTITGLKRMDSILYGDKARKIKNAFDNAMLLTY